MLSAKPWKLELVLMLYAGVMISLALAIAAGMSLNRFAPTASDAARSLAEFLIGTMGFHGASLFLIHWFLRRHQCTWIGFINCSPAKLRRVLAVSFMTLIVFLPAAMGLNMISEAILNLLNYEAVPQHAVQILRETTRWQDFFMFGLTAIVLAPIVEESLFRGILYPAIKAAKSAAAALWTTSLMFAVIHGNLMTFVPLLAFALVLVTLYERTDTLLAPMLVHALFNAANFALLVTGWNPWNAVPSP